MAVSHPRPDPSSPASVAEAGFSTTRRGFSPDQVRAFLVSVAAELGRLQERERQLEAQLRDAKKAPAAPLELDEETAAQLLGEETVRVLRTARESASLIKVRAEESAARFLSEANNEANRVRQDAEVEAARKRQDSTGEAEAEVALAKQQGREMVTEARAYRERVLADLDRRTKLARQQIEELVHGRDRLLQVFERARLVAVDVTSGLAAIDSPDELVNLSPTTGPVPIMVPTTRIETLEVDDVVDEPEEIDQAADDAIDEIDESAQSDTDDVEEVEVVSSAEPIIDEVEMADPEPEPDGNVVALFPNREVETFPEQSDDADKTDVEGIFDRLRTESESDVDEPTGLDADADGDADAEIDDADAEIDDGEVDHPEPTPFSLRDEALVPLIVSAARKLKRVLADEQNGVLDSLRQKEPVTTLDAVLPEPDEHFASHVDAIEDDLLGAAAAGANVFGLNDTKTLRRKLTKADAVADANALVCTGLIEPLRDRLDRAVVDGSGDNDDITKRVRAVYREWKTQHIDDQLDDVFRFAYGGGIAASAKDDISMVWSIDPDEPSCPDCEDNSLAGPVAVGESFPTGHTSAPAHSGCRCLTLPADPAI